MAVSVSSETATGFADVKTDLASDGISVHWESGDAISILYADQNRQFTTTGSGATADFTGVADPEGRASVWAVYPYDPANKLVDGDSLEVTIPSVQYARKDSYADGANVSVGKVIDGKVKMYNIGSLIRLQIAGGDITSVTVRAKYDDDNTVIPVSGVFHVGFSAGLPVAKAYSTSHMVKLLPPAGSSVFAPGDYCIAVASVTMAQGFDLIYTKAAARGIKATVRPFSFQRSCIKNILAQDSSTEFVEGRFIEFDAVDLSTGKAIQPFTEDLPSGTSTPEGGKVSTGGYYQNCPEEYLYDLVGEGTRGFFLITGSGRAGIYNYASVSSDRTCYFGLPHFANKKLRSIEMYTTLTRQSTSRYDLRGSSSNQNVMMGDSYTSVFKYPQVIPYNGNWLYATDVWQYGIGYGQIDVPDSANDTKYYLAIPQIRKLVLFYEGADIEEVVSVKVTLPSEAEKFPSEITGSFKAWNYGSGATYSAGIDYKKSDAGTWTSVTGSVTGQTFTVSMPSSGLGSGEYLVTPWAGVAGSDGAKMYGKEQTIKIAKTKVLQYNFLQGSPETWKSGTTATQWPFKDGNPSISQIGTVVTIHDAEDNVLKADYTGIVETGRSRSITLHTGRGWRIRNSATLSEGDSYTDCFRLTLPKIPGYRLTSITMFTFYNPADKWSIITSGGEIVSGGEAKKPSSNGSSCTWTLSGTEVNTEYIIKTNPVGTVTKAGPYGYIFEPASITLEYEEP